MHLIQAPVIYIQSCHNHSTCISA